VLYTRDVHWAIDLAADNQAFFDALDRQTGEWFPVCGWNGHVDYTVT
jgi:hypothetical protein